MSIKNYMKLKKSCLRMKRTLTMKRKTMPVGNSCFYSRIGEVVPNFKNECENISSHNGKTINTKGYARVYKVRKNPTNPAVKVKDVGDEY